MARQRRDVVVVGSGIAGGGAAIALARAGHDVLLLEREVRYRDKVRGEVMATWGVAEALELGVLDVLLAAGGHVVTKVIGYDEMLDAATAEANTVRVDGLLPGVPGILDIGHPQACAALARAAADAGVEVLTGVADVEVTAGTIPEVRFRRGALRHVFRAGVVVGADGRRSTVRQALGLPVITHPVRTIGGGLLVEELWDWPEDQFSLGTEGDARYFVVPHGDGVVRLYLLHQERRRPAWAAARTAEAFLRAFDLRCLPQREAILASRPIGPLAYHPMGSADVPTPVAPGIVLIGDAAGWNDPLIGQGLSVALRDAHLVRDALATGDWCPRAFTPYVIERRERMRRLRILADVMTDLAINFHPDSMAHRRAFAELAARDPLVAAFRGAIQVGTHRVPDAAFGASTLAAISAATEGGTLVA